MSIKIDFTEIYKTYTPSKLEELWNFIAKKLHSKVKRLMNQSKNVHGQSYMPYSKSYSEVRDELGLSKSVNLQYTSDMYKAISFKSTKEGFYIFLVDSESNKKAIRLMSMKNWQFFEWGSELEKELNRVIKIWYQKNM